MPDLRNPFFADIIVGVRKTLERTQYQTMIGLGDSSAHTEMAIIESIIDRQMDGTILIGSTEDRSNY